MAVSYSKLFHLLIDRKITNAQLMRQANISANIITKMKKGGYISLESAEKICEALDCSISDILEFQKEEVK